MSNKKLQKEKIKAKQRQMQEIKSGDYIPPAPKVDNVKAALDKAGDLDPEENKRVEKSIKKAVARADAGGDVDPRMLDLFKEFNMYKYMIIGLVVLALAIMLISMLLVDRKVIDDQMNTNLLIIAAIVMFAAVVIGFGRARPLREDIRAWSIINDMALRKSGGAHGASKTDVDKLLLSRTRNRRIPPTAEFRKIRRVYLVLTTIAVALMILAVIMAGNTLQDITIPIILIIVSFGILLITLYIQRVKMKPLREAWVREVDAQIKAVGKKKRS